MKHVSLKNKQLLQKIPIIGNDAPKKDMNRVQQELKQDVQNKAAEKDFILTPLLTLSPEQHWVVAIISPDKIQLFDSTLQTRGQQYKISRFNVSQYDCINGDAIQNKDGTICGLCSAEFMAEASKKNNLRESERNIDDICFKVAKNVYEYINIDEARKQLTSKYVKLVEESLLARQTIQNVINHPIELERQQMQYNNNSANRHKQQNAIAYLYKQD